MGQNMLMDYYTPHSPRNRTNKGAFKYYVSTFFFGRWEVLVKMLTLMTLGCDQSLEQKS